MAKKRDGEATLIDALFAASPREFVATRERLAGELKAAGRRDEARALAKARRPSASVWAVNQLARREPEAIAELLAIGEELRAGQRRLLRGAGDAAALMSGARTARQKVATLTRRAEALLGEAGQQATATLARKIAQTLQAAPIGDDEARAALAAGRLTHDLTPPSGFGAAAESGDDLSAALAASLGGGGAPAAARAATETQRATKHGAAKHAATKHAGHAAAKHAAAQQAAAAASAAAAKHTAAAERRRAAAERKRAGAGERVQRRTQAAARKQAARLQRQAIVADRVVADRRRTVDRARAAVERAERELRVAKDALADAEAAAAAAHRAAGE